ncbi:hypothetical protein FCM35_KLT14540 [Carex littledalei]|uniref:Transmembrane protein n=1 Tax=Carex littledalei TaxID=544730 RepID=A0A833QM06_9POAL|nr:hypothetical protein FCM35_KLT14540 [Carex littledalei]
MEGLEPVHTHKKEETPGTSGTATAAWLLVGASLLLLGLGGAALLVWWALVFHPSNQQLWMVPVSLVLLGTPMVAWLSIFTSSACRRFDMMRTMRARSMQEQPVIVVQTERTEMGGS